MTNNKRSKIFSSQASHSSRKTIYSLTVVLASCSLLYELLIAQTLAVLAANTVVWYCLTIGVYLAGMGVGALLHEKYPTKTPWKRLFHVEIILCIVGALAVPILHFAHAFGLRFQLFDQLILTNIIFFGTAFILISTIGLLTGFELPLLIDLGNTTSKERSVTNRVLSSDYVGSLIAGFAFPLAFVPNFDLISVGIFTAGTNLAIAIFALWKAVFSNEQAIKRLVLCATVAFSMLTGLIYVQAVEQYFIKKYYAYWDHGENLAHFMGPLAEFPNVFRTRSPYQNIDLFYDKEGYDTDYLIDFYSTKYLENPEKPRNYMLYLNGDFQFSSSYEEYYHEYFAHIPIAFNGRVPEKVLVMGAGDGLLIRELVKYKEIKKIVHVDLDHKLVELARTNPILTAMNEHALEDQRVETHFGDAYYYIRNSTEQFDAIYLDFPYAVDYNLSRLFSREFFHFARARMARDGYLVMDAPGLENLDIDWEIYSNTLLAAGFKYVRPYLSHVEEFRQDAYDFVLNRLFGSTKNLESSQYDKAEFNLYDFSASIRMGFVIAQNSKSDLPIYWNEGIKRHVLTKERMQLTLEKQLPPIDKIDPSRVNSILRPTLPVNEVWNIRTAW